MSLNVDREEILQGNIIKGLFKLSLPLMLVNLINTLYGIVDTYFVGKMGELQVGAISLVTPITNCGIAFATGLSAASVALIARALGKNDKEKASRITTNLLSLTVILGILITILTLCFKGVILGWLKTPADVYDDTLAYYIGISFDYLFLFILTVFHSIRQSCGDSRTGSRLNIIASLLNVILDPIFIFVFQLGTFGAALATVLSKALMCPFALYSLFKDETVRVDFKKYKIQLPVMTSIIKIAVPASLGQFLSSFGFVLMSKEIVSYGSIVISAYGVGSHIVSLFYIPINGIGTALSTFIGQTLGAEMPQRSKECYRQAMKLVGLLSIAVTIFGFLGADFFVHLFIHNASDTLLKIAIEYADYSVATAFFMGWFSNLCGVFNGSAHTKISMILSASRILFIRMPIVYLLSALTDLQYTGIWISMILSNLLTCIMGEVLYRHYPWDSNSISI